MPLIRRSDALDKINKLEEQCAERSDRAGGEWIVKAFNAIMSCEVQEEADLALYKETCRILFNRCRAVSMIDRELCEKCLLKEQCEA